MQQIHTRVVEFPAGRAHAAPVPYHLIEIHLGAAVRSVCRIEGRAVSSLQAPGDVQILPAGMPSTWDLAAPATALLVQLPVTLLNQTAATLGMRGGAVQLSPRLQLRDAHILHIAMALQEEARAGSPGGRIFTDSLATALAARVAQNYACQELRSQPGAARLQAWRLRRVTEFIDAHLDAELSLADLARVAGLSVSHFKPLFKRATGRAVHQYVIERRVARARELLLAGQLSQSEIALAAGFAHQSHMARWVRRRLGTTPTALAASGR